MNDIPARPKSVRAASKNLAEDTRADAPSAQFVAQGKRVVTKQDSQGRTLKIKFLSTLDRMRISKVVGGDLSKNDVYLGYATLAYCVTAIDEEPVPPPVTVLELEFLVERLGDAGLAVVAETYQVDFADLTKGINIELAKN